MNMHADIKPASAAVSSRAMLGALRIRQWSGHKLDRAVTDQTNRDHAAAADAGRYNKALLAKGALSEIVTITGRARQAFYARTLPWHDDGNRILSAAGYLDFAKVMRELRAEFDDAVSRFVANYSDSVESAKTRLGTMFKATDYPAPSDLASRFGFDVVIQPMPDASDFRVDVSDAAAEAIRADIQARTDAAIRHAMADVFTRICLTVGHMAEKLTETRQTDNGPAAAIFRDSLVGNVRELVALLPTLNITGDAKLAEVASRMGEELCRYDADALREDATARRDTAKAAADILAEVTNYMA